MFAVVDIETTGSHASANSITEIAIVISDGIKVVDQYSSLIRPDHHIPIAIQNLTGIDNNMVADAPSFADIALEIREILAEHIFVAHNVHFDLSFVQAAFKAVNIEYKPRRLCTVRYGRRVEKGLRSYSLSNLIKHFHLNNEAAHRAWGDAKVTTELLHLLLAKDHSGQWQQMIKLNSGELNLPAKLPEQEFHDLPMAAGVYYFYNANGEVLYIGKASKLKSRVASHFSGNKESAKTSAFLAEIAHIDYKLCGNILLAGLWEDHEIRQKWPPFNRAQKNPKKKFGVFHYETQKGLLALGINRVNNQQSFLVQFHNLEKARTWMAEKIEAFGLDPELCGFPRSQAQASSNHQQGVEALLKDLKYSRRQRILLCRGRDDSENGFILMGANGFQSFGFVPKDQPIEQVVSLNDYKWEVATSASTAGILNDGLKRIRFQEILISEESDA